MTLTHRLSKVFVLSEGQMLGLSGSYDLERTGQSAELSIHMARVAQDFRFPLDVRTMYVYTHNHTSTLLI